MDKNTQLITGPAALSPHFNSFEKKDKRSSFVFFGSRFGQTEDLSNHSIRV